MTTFAELNQSFDKLGKTVLKVKRERDSLLSAAAFALRHLERKDAPKHEREQAIDFLKEAIEEARS